MHILKAGLIIIILLIVTCTDGQVGVPKDPSRGIPYYPFPAEVTQPDGSRITLSGKGDRVIHWTETPDGYTALKSGKGFYEYATRNERGDLVPSGIPVGSAKAALLPGIKKHLRYSKEQVEGFNKAYFKNDGTKFNPNPFPSMGTHNVLLILAEFPDIPSSVSQGEFSSMMNDADYKGTGSFRDFYITSSFNNLILTTTVTVWVEVSQNMAYYGDNDINGYDIAPQEFVREAVDLVEAAGFDFSPFDNNLDGYVDEILVIHSGYGEEYPGTGDSCIWAHSYHLDDLSVEYDGVILDNYIVAAELMGNSGTDISHIGVLTHEFGHSLGLPDLYDADGPDNGYAFDLNFWDLMAYGSWNNDGASPANNNAWSKEFLGWITIPEIKKAGSFTLNNASEYPEAYRINTSTYDEFFIMENRQLTGLDIDIPGTGMLIYHIDKNYPGWETDEVNADSLHQGFDLEEADDIRDTITYDGDSYPGFSNNQVFSASSTPNSDAWNGAETKISLQNITESGEVITFDVLDATFDQAPPAWSVNPAIFSDSGQLTSLVFLEKDTVRSGYLAAFSGPDCRGIAPAIWYPDSGYYFFDLQIYSNSTGGEMLTFKYYDVLLDSVYDLHEDLEFTPGMDHGEVFDPYHLHHYRYCTTSFSAGWNWFSINVLQEDMTLNSVLPACVVQGDYIKNQTQSATYYDGYGWFGSLTELEPIDLYLIKLNSGCGVDISGVSVDPSATPISLVTGWNWISYLPQVSLPIDEALSSLTPGNLDYIKNQTSSSTYYDGFGWFGSLTEMHPTGGYMFKISGAGTLEYPSAAPSGKKSAGLLSPEVPESAFDPHRFEFNGSVAASIYLDGLPAGSPDDCLYAYAGDECRGMSRGIFFEPGGSTVYPIMVYSNDPAGETITFRYYNAGDGQFYLVEEFIIFEKDMIIGDAFKAVELHAGSTIGINDYQVPESTVEVYPNPVGEKLFLRYTGPTRGELLISIYDINGRIISENYFKDPLHRSEQIEIDVGSLETGLYIIRLNENDRFSFFKVIKD